MTNFSPHYIFLCGGNKLILSSPNYELHMDYRSADMGAAVISLLIGHLNGIFGHHNFLLSNIIAIIRCGVAAPTNDINTVY